MIFPFILSIFLEDFPASHLWLPEAITISKQSEWCLRGSAPWVPSENLGSYLHPKSFMDKIWHISHISPSKMHHIVKFVHFTSHALPGRFTRSQCRGRLVSLMMSWGINGMDLSPGLKKKNVYNAILITTKTPNSEHALAYVVNTCEHVN